MIRVVSKFCSLVLLLARCFPQLEVAFHGTDSHGLHIKGNISRSVREIKRDI